MVATGSPLSPGPMWSTRGADRATGRPAGQPQAQGVSIGVATGSGSSGDGGNEHDVP